LVQFVPVAPPRMLPESGFVDVAVQYGQSVYGGAVGGMIADQLSAMPSVHVAWCVLVAVVVVRVSATRWRWLAVLHAVATVVVVVVTANHFWADAIVAVALLAAACAVQWGAATLVRRGVRPAVPPVGQQPTGQTAGERRVGHVVVRQRTAGQAAAERPEQGAAVGEGQG